MKLAEQLFQLVNSLFGIGTASFERRGRAAIEVGSKNIYKTVSGIFLAVFHEPNFRSKTDRAFDELCGRPRVQTESVRDAHLALRGDGLLLLSSNSPKHHL